MPNLDINSATTTNFQGTVANVVVPSKTPDGASSGLRVWSFPDASKHLGYYENIPEINSALHVLGQRVCGLGYTTDTRTQSILENIRGWGNESFTTIITQLFEEAEALGDSFAEIVWSEDGDPINLKKMFTGNVKLYLDESGLIDNYEQVVGNKTIKFQPKDILHITSRRMSNQIHGNPIVVTLKKILDAKNQAFEDEITIRHRDKALGIVYYDTDDAGKIAYANSKIEEAVKKGEMVGLPKDTAEILPFPNKSPSDRIAWLQYLDNLFYQIVGTPKVLVTSEGYTEAGGKAGLLAFEPTEISKKIIVEEVVANQLGLIVKFNRSPSLLGETLGTEQKNAGQTGIQDNETEVSATRTE